MTVSPTAIRLHRDLQREGAADGHVNRRGAGPSLPLTLGPPQPYCGVGKVAYLLHHFVVANPIIKLYRPCTTLGISKSHRALVLSSPSYNEGG